MREVDLERVNLAQANVVLVYASVSFLRAGKRGGSSFVSLAAC